MTHFAQPLLIPKINPIRWDYRCFHKNKSPENALNSMLHFNICTFHDGEQDKFSIDKDYINGIKDIELIFYSGSREMYY